MNAAAILALLAPAAAARAGQLHDEVQLAQFGLAALAGLSPWADDYAELADAADRDWRHGAAGRRYLTSVDANGRKSCHPDDDPGQTSFLKDGAPDAYAKALAFAASHPQRRNAGWAFEARTKVLELAATSGFHGPAGNDYSGGNQCVLDLATSVPVWIATAELLEASGAFTDRDRAYFAVWLEAEVYPLVAWASRVRRNNWGAAGSLSARMAARYMASTRVVAFEEAPEPRVLFARDAVLEHDAMQRARMGTDWPGDSRCNRFGIQHYGGIPDELRRGAAGCEGEALPDDDSAHNYQSMHVALLTMHAEVLRREGDPSLYELEAAPGVPALLQSILFVIDNPVIPGLSWDWGLRTGALRTAARYYGDARLEAQVDANRWRGFRGGRIYPYTQIRP